MLSLRILKPGGKAETYAHENRRGATGWRLYRTGKRHDLGFQVPAASDGEPDYYEMRLLGPDGADPTTGEPLQDGEFKGFLKVEGA
ncbi:uncharacterized protein K441DRAFT_656860 [Cenococcum geophilum 1.58]|uniref:uncharacterized protein n=1 Tax=Cenococcum geophilum 1.58 TaxID=794803 RepID=UPI00358FAE94|nr:hypothetical protein K441DRAFT_656860 [Cenococcum geophilum 1.58]